MGERAPFQTPDVVSPSDRKIERRIVDTECGIGNCRPKGLQCCANVCAMVGVYAISGLLTSVLRTYTVSQITNLEKQFGFSDSQLYLLIRLNDIGFFCTILFAGYFSRSVHIPRMLALSTVIYGIAGIICSVAYFISKNSIEPEQKSDVVMNSQDITTYWNPDVDTKISVRAPLCSFEERTPGNCSGTIEKNGGPNQNQNIFFPMLIIGSGMFLQGVGKAPRYPMIATYIDDNVDKIQTPMYVGIVTGVAMFGPALALAISGLLNTVYVTINNMGFFTEREVSIGAWWVGFLVVGVASIIVAIPLVTFPKWTKLGVVDVTRRKLGKEKVGKRIRCKRCCSGFFRSLGRLFANPLFWLLTIATCLHFLLMSASATFSAEYLEVGFSVPSWKANALQGAASLLAAAIGTVIGGIVTSKMKLHPVTCTRLVLVLNITAAVLGTHVLFLKCTQADIVGFTSEISSLFPGQSNDTSVSCKDMCHCDMTDYFPLCGSDGRNYFSPCIAGCTTRENQVFNDCSCIEGGGSGTPSLCDPDCRMMIPFLGAVALVDFITALSYMPVLYIFMRCIQDKDKSFAVGLAAFFSSMLGWIPGPMLFEKLLVLVCLLWNSTCGDTGTCSIYNTKHLRYMKTGFETVLRVLAAIVYFIVVLKARKKTDWSLDDEVDTVFPLDQDENMDFLEEAEMATTPTGWNSEPIFKGEITPKRFGSFNKK